MAEDLHTQTLTQLAAGLERGCIAEDLRVRIAVDGLNIGHGGFALGERARLVHDKRVDLG